MKTFLERKLDLLERLTLLRNKAINISTEEQRWYTAKIADIQRASTKKILKRFMNRRSNNE